MLRSDVLNLQILIRSGIELALDFFSQALKN